MLGSIFWLLLISECYLQHSVRIAKGLPSLISSHFKPLCRCLTKPGDSTFFRWSWFLIQLCSCHSHPSRFTEADLLLPSLNVSHLPPRSLLPQSGHSLYLPGGLGTLSAHVQAKISKLCVRRDSWLYVNFIWLFALLFFERKRESELP